MTDNSSAVQRLLCAFSGSGDTARHSSILDHFREPSVSSAAACIAGSDVENMGKAAVFLLQSNDLVPMNRLSGAGGTEDEHDSHAVYL